MKKRIYLAISMFSIVLLPMTATESGDIFGLLKGLSGSSGSSSSSSSTQQGSTATQQSGSSAGNILGGILQGLSGGSSSSNTQNQSQQQQQSGGSSSSNIFGSLLQGLGGSSSGSSGGLGDIVSGVGSVLNGVLSSSNLTVADIVGTWNYVEPAVDFKSDNFLMKAGGAAASSTIVKKIEPYYNMLGVKNLQFVVNQDGTFSLGFGMLKGSGTIETDGNGEFIFHFQALGSMNIGSMTAYMSKNLSGQLSLTFDATKLLSLVDAIGKISSNSTVQTVTNLLNSYDGLTVGFLLARQ